MSVSVFACLRACVHMPVAVSVCVCVCVIPCARAPVCISAKINQYLVTSCI